MRKSIFIFLFAMLFTGIARAQKSFNVTIKLDSSINPSKVSYNYYNGRDIVFLPDSFNDKRIVVVNDQYYSPFASITINYVDAEKRPYNSEFFISDKPATINLFCKANKQNELKYSDLENATPVYDTIVNKTWVKLGAFMVDSSVAGENKAFDDFLNRHKGFYRNDSLRKVFNTFYKRRLNRTMEFLKQYPDDYFSFWYFIQQVAQPNSVLGNDTAYLKEQLTYLKAVFPEKYTGSIEGKSLLKKYETALNPPLQLNDDAPVFSLTTIDGHKISLQSFKGKYILLDFWATWCPPCVAEIPYVKEIRKKHAAEKLQIIGISADYDSKKLTAFVKAQQMNWLHFYDKHREIGPLYGVGAIPVLILINKEGKMVYNSNLKGNNKEMLTKLLEGMD